MNLAAFQVLSPLVFLSATIGAVMLLIACYRSQLATAMMAALGLILAFVSLVVVAPTAPRQITPLLIIDGYALFFAGLVIAACLLVVVLSYGYLEAQDINKEEYYLLVLLVGLGCGVLVASSHFASFFLGLETVSVALYGLIAYPRTRLISIEAAVKYLILAGVSSAFLLFGMALIYSQSGTMEFGLIGSSSARANDTVVMLGTALLIVGMGFKLAVVPFHMWTPDVYEGAPAPVTALLATVSKGSVFALVLRYFSGMDLPANGGLTVLFSSVAIASMLLGNLLALLQNNVKRILAYSSIAHLGYLLVAFIAGGPAAVTAVGYYLAAYFVTMLGAFGAITVLSNGGADRDSLENYRGLGRQRPWVAGVFTAMLLSLAGIPLTAGFIGKFYVMATGIGSTLWLLVAVLVVTSVMGLYYYLRVIAVMYDSRAEGAKEAGDAYKGSWAARVVLAVLVLMLLWLGVYPSSLLAILEATVSRMI